MVLPRSSAVGGVSPPLLRRAGRPPAVLAASGASRREWDRDPALQLTRPRAQQRGRPARLPAVPPQVKRKAAHRSRHSVGTSRRLRTPPCCPPPPCCGEIDKNE